MLGESKNKNDMSYAEQRKYPWYRIILGHVVLAGILSYLVYGEAKGNAEIELQIGAVVDVAGTIVPNIVGLANLSSSPMLGALYQIFVWSGAPLYFILFWRMTPYGYYKVKRSEKSSKFWKMVIGGFLLSFVPIFFPRTDQGLSALKPVSGFELLMHEYYLLFMIVGWSMMMATSMFMAITMRLAILRIFDNDGVK